MILVSLAKSLAYLAAVGERGKSQLIVITHDMKFVEEMLQPPDDDKEATQLGVDYYYRVTKNESGHSRIKKVKGTF